MYVNCNELISCQRQTIVSKPSRFPFDPEPQSSHWTKRWEGSYKIWDPTTQWNNAWA